MPSRWKIGWQIVFVLSIILSFCNSVILSFCILYEPITLLITFLTKSAKLLIFYIIIHCDRHFQGYPHFLTLWPRLWSLAYFENFNISNNFGTVSAEALILHMTILSKGLSVGTNIFYPLTLILEFNLFMLPFKKRGILFFNCRSVDQALSAEKMLSAKYLLTPLLENRQTWYSSGPLRVDIS